MLIEPELRVQIAFTHDPVDRSALDARAARHLELLDAAVMPLALLVPDGLGFQKYYPDLCTVAGLSPISSSTRGAA